MEKVVIGIDVAKDKLDVAALQSGQWLTRRQLANTEAGHQQLLALVSSLERVHVVLEATGSYHAWLVCRLVEAGVLVSVINPLVIKRYGQMKLRRAKTDRTDAMLIAEYGVEQNPKPHQRSPEVIEHLRQLQSQVELLTRHRSALLNQQHAHARLPSAMALCSDVLKDAIEQHNRHLIKLEAEQARLIESAFARERDLLRSIKGIGPKTSTVILAIVGDMGRFETHKQLAAYAGLNPAPAESGTSLKGKGHISKQGHAALRTSFYQAALSARTYNPACAGLYQRLRAKGKPPKVALIAVANKLLKQSFAIIKSGVPYDANYQTTLAV